MDQVLVIKTSKIIRVGAKIFPNYRYFTENSYEWKVKITIENDSVYKNYNSN